MLQQVLTGQAKAIILLGVAVGLFLYFLPSVLAFVRAKKRFWLVLILNIVLTFVQSAIMQKLFPGVLTVHPGDAVGIWTTSLIVNFGPGWVALLVWALWPGETDPRLARAQQTKTYDAVAALPLILWFAYGALQLRPVLAHDAGLVASGAAPLFNWVQLVALSMTALFDLLLIYLLMVRDKPVAKSHGALPRIFAFAGTFLGVGILQFPVAPLSLPMQLLSAVLIGIGSLGSLLVLWRLGKSFSIMPEARKLVTAGPYAHVRHPLYTVEMISIAGTALQFAAPWSWLVALGVMVLLWIRSHFEEQVLAETYPEYATYRLRTKRFIPGVI